MRDAAPGSARLFVFLGLAALVAGSLLYYAISQRRPPIPADRDHARSLTAGQCLVCHGPGGREARGPNHPLNDQCFNCHDWA